MIIYFFPPYFLKRELQKKIISISSVPAPLVKITLQRITQLLRSDHFCLLYALTARRLLKAECQLYLGSYKDEKKWCFHAWLKQGMFPIVGCDEVHKYKIITIY